MKTIKKTKFYPVDIDNKIIHNSPEPRERDVARKWKSNIIGIRGSHLLSAPIYARSFSIVQD